MQSLGSLNDVYKMTKHERFSQRSLEKMMEDGKLYNIKKAVGRIEDDEDYGYISQENQPPQQMQKQITTTDAQILNLLFSLKNDMANIKQDNNKLKEDNKKLKEDNKKLITRVEVLEKDNKKLKEVNKKLIARVEELETDHKKLKEENKKLFTRVEELEKKDLLKVRANTLKELFKYLAAKVASLVSPIVDATKPNWFNVMQSYCSSNIVIELPISLSALQELWSTYKILSFPRNYICHNLLDDNLALVSGDEKKAVQWYLDKTNHSQNNH